MKRLSYYFVLALMGGVISCSKMEDKLVHADLLSDTEIKGIVAYVINEKSVNDTLDISFSDEKDTIYLSTKPLPVGTTPIDISNVTVELEPDKSASVNPSSPMVFDLREVKELLVTAEDGTVQIYRVKAIISEPYAVYPEYETNVTELWSKTGEEMQLMFPGSGKGMAVSGDYLVLLDNAVDKSGNAAIRLYDKLTGAYVKNIDYYEGGWGDPRSYSWNLDADESGNLMMGRLNSGGAGFMLDYWPAIGGVPSIKLNSMAGADLPENTGKRMRVVGDLEEGKAYVYASAAHFYGAAQQAPQFAMWEFNNGSPVSARPQVFTYTEAGAGWYNAVVQRASMEDNTLYISWGDETGYPNDAVDSRENLNRINFHIFKPGADATTYRIDPLNFGYRLLDSRVFQLLDGTFMAMLEQRYSTAGAMKLQVFNITNPEDYRKTPGTEGYESFRLFESPESTPTSNDGRYGHVAVGALSSNEAIVYAYYPNPTAALAKVHAYKLTVNPND